MILELLASAAKYDSRLKLRFFFWGAEENGLLGSKHYVDTLPTAELARIRAYLNFDMCSPRFPVPPSPSFPYPPVLLFGAAGLMSGGGGRG